MLDQLLDAARAGESRALVVRGEAGVGKSALLDYLVEQASGCRVAHAAGVESEMEPDRFLVGLAALSLLSDAAAEHPLVCVVDDAQWLDQASAQVPGFVARRLVADPVGDPVLVWRAAERLGIGTQAATPAAEAGLLEVGARVRSGTRWCGRRPTGLRRHRNAKTCMAPWPRPPTGSWIPTAGPGIWPRPRPGPARAAGHR